MPSKQDEASGYDLNTEGTIVEVTANHGSDVGWNVKAGTAVDLVIEVRGDDVGWQTHKTASATTDENDGATLPEARRVRIRNTTTAADTAEALLGVGQD